MEILIKHAKLNDSESIAGLSNQLGYDSVTTDILSRLNKILENPDNCVYVAIDNKIVVGWIHGFYSLRVESDFFVEIGGLVVNEDFRKNGIGKKLVERVIEWASLKKCDKVRVRCNVLRKESHRFYEKIGFEMTKEQKIFIKSLK